MTLTRYPTDTGNEFVARVQELFKNWGRIDTFKGVMALSKDCTKTKVTGLGFK